jgi:hypothetical protein
MPSLLSSLSLLLLERGGGEGERGEGKGGKREYRVSTKSITL